MTDLALESYREAVIEQWTTEIQNRIIPNTMDLLRECVQLHDNNNCADYDSHYWAMINNLRNELGKDTLSQKCLMTRLSDALDERDYDKASELQIEMQKKIEELVNLYLVYKKNIF